MANNLMQLDGFKELAAAMRELSPRIAKNALRAAVASGAGVVRDDAKARAPESTAGEKSVSAPPPGTLKRAIAIKRDKDSQGNLAAKYSVFVRQARNGSVGQKGVKAYGRMDAYYAKFVEFGTSKMAAKPFLRPAFEARKEDAITAIGLKLDEYIQKTASELADKR